MVEVGIGVGLYCCLLGYELFLLFFLGAVRGSPLYGPRGGGVPLLEPSTGFYCLASRRF
jgi:hypothetical protein